MSRIVMRDVSRIVMHDVNSTSDIRPTTPHDTAQVSNPKLRRVISDK